jgi:protein-disulfide isomerase
VFVLSTACALAAVLIAANQISARTAKEPATDATAAGAVRPAPSLLAGIPQRGAALGSPTAPVTLVEYADLQCPYCGHWARETLPVLVDRYVRTGRLRIVFRGLAFIGPDSNKALRTAVAAGRHNHLWDVVHALYERQGVENAGWVTDGLVRDIAAVIPGLDAEKVRSERSKSDVAGEIERAAAAAQAAGVSGTPTFQVGRTGGRLDLLRVSSLGPEGIVPAIEAVRAR